MMQRAREEEATSPSHAWLNDANRAERNGMEKGTRTVRSMERKTRCNVEDRCPPRTMTSSA